MATSRSEDTVTPDGAGERLPRLPDTVEISEEDIQAALTLWDRLMPDARGQLDAEVVNG